MTDLSATDTRPRHIFTNDEKAHLYTKIRLIMGQIDQSKGALFDYQYADENLQAFIEGRAQALPRIVPDPVPYVQDDWSDPQNIPVKALNLSKTLTNLLNREGIDTVWHLMSMPEAEIFGDDRPRNLGIKSVQSIRQSMAEHDFDLILDPEWILLEDAARKTLGNLFALRVYNISIIELRRLFAKFGFINLTDLVDSTVTIADICTELLEGDYDCAKSLNTRGVSYPDDGGEAAELSLLPARVERIARSVVIVLSDILSRYGLPPLKA